MEYYIASNGQNLGPYSVEQLAQQRITPDTMLWTQGMPNWAPASQIPELKQLFTVANINELLVANVAKPEALAFIFAITFNMPCIVALAATYQETHSAKWTTLIALYYTFGALIIACVAYHIGLLIW